MRKQVGRAFKVSSKTVKGYGYAKRPKTSSKRAMSPNPVTAIQAINGRGAYKKASISRKARLAQMKAPPRKPGRVAPKKHAASRVLKTNSSLTRAIPRASRSETMLRNLRRSMSRNKHRAYRRHRGLRPNVWRGDSGDHGVVAAKRRGGSSAVAAFKKMSKRRGAARFKAGKRVSPKSAFKPTAAQIAARKKRRKSAKRKTTAKKAVRRVKRKSAKRVARKSVRRVKRKSAKKATARKAVRRVKRKSAKRSVKRVSKRRSSKKMAANRRRRSHRRNGRTSMRANGLMDVLKLGGLVVVGLGLQKVAASYLAKFLTAEKEVPAATTAPAETTTTAGLGLLPESVKPYGGMIAAVAVAGAAGYATHKFVKDASVRTPLLGGIVAGALHTIVVGLLKKSTNETAKNLTTALSGVKDGTAARLAAMYGLGQSGQSIMPHYASTSGMGEYFDGMSGLGIYPSAAQAGVGEYFGGGVGEYFGGGVSGLGAYESNPEIYQAAAGIGAMDHSNSAHIDPNSNLDRALTIAEAAAGVGSLYQAAAGLGAVQTVQSSSTWVPGTSDPSIWAGVQAVSQGQEATAMVPAGLLQTDGGAGIFG